MIPLKCPKCHNKTFYIDAILKKIEYSFRIVTIKLVCTKCGESGVIRAISTKTWLEIKEGRKSE